MFREHPEASASARGTCAISNKSGATVFEKTSERRSVAIPAEEWVRDDFLRLVRERDEGVRDLAKRCVDDILDAGLVPIA